MAAVFVGTSGWTYKDWRGRFYPPRLAQREWLAYYSARFRTVELNVTTYRLPKPADIQRWNNVPGDFRYTVKLSRLITHRKHPGSPRIFVDRFFAALAGLEPRIANVLAQLPPHLTRDEAALAAFIDALPSGRRYVIEFRHPSWYADSVYALLRGRRISMCLHDLEASVAPIVLTGPVLYVRLHGPVRAYAGSYRRARLEAWAKTIVQAMPSVDDAYVYFNNDERAFAARNAASLEAQLEVLLSDTPAPRGKMGRASTLVRAFS